MAHGRSGPDIVMTIRYVGMPEIKQLTMHEDHRTPDGPSAIDPARSHLNAILHGPENQSVAVSEFFADDKVKRPTKQAEAPFVQMVLSASPEYFRTSKQGAGEWDDAKLEKWRDDTMKWLKAEYGDDLLHVSLHLDEDTPHMHILVIPTYSKKPRKPGRQKRSETPGEFEARKVAAENAPTIRVAGRSSNAYWKRNFCRRFARQSYHKAMEPLGLGYGRDFIGDDLPSPKRTETGTWVREQANVVKNERITIDAEWDKVKKLSVKLDQRETFLQRVVERVWAIADAVAEKVGLPLPKRLSDALSDLEDAVNAYNQPDVSEADDTPTPDM